MPSPPVAISPVPRPRHRCQCCEGERRAEPPLPPVVVEHPISILLLGPPLSPPSPIHDVITTASAARTSAEQSPSPRRCCSAPLIARRQPLSIIVSSLSLPPIDDNICTVIK